MFNNGDGVIVWALLWTVFFTSSVNMYFTDLFTFSNLRKLIQISNVLFFRLFSMDLKVIKVSLCKATASLERTKVIFNVLFRDKNNHQNLTRLIGVVLLASHKPLRFIGTCREIVPRTESTVVLCSLIRQFFPIHPNGIYRYAIYVWKCI